MAKVVAAPIGFVGLGNMGVPMVRCLAKAGHKVLAYDSRSGVAAALAAEPANKKLVAVAETLAAVGAAAKIVITMLPDSDVVRAVALGDKKNPGLAAYLQRGSVIVDMSSSYALDTRKLAGKLALQGISVIDAPVSGGVGKAVTGTLAIMAGGDAAMLDAVAPVLAAMGSVHRTGPLGSGHAIKALNNYVSAAGLIATCEALLVAEKFGLAPETVIDVLNASTGRNNTTENKAAKYLIPRNYTSGFALALMEKDVGMARSLAADLGLDAEALAFVTAYLGRVSGALGQGADHTAVMQFVEKKRS
jgi:3-hydroxyisobutyrate dehydrogenase